MAGIRVIAGSAKGRKLQMVPGHVTRPISDRVKEALFNILSIKSRGSRWLDLFAGTGSVGIEALSRGAEWVTFIENNRLAVNTIVANLEITGFGDWSEILRVDAFEYLSGETEQAFDYIYIAPPQYARLWVKTLVKVDEAVEWLERDGWVIAQMHPKEYEELSFKALNEFDQRRYGNTLLVFYKRSGS